MINRIYDLPAHWLGALMPLVFLLEMIDWSTLINDIVVIAYSSNVMFSRFDPFNIAKILGKLIKFVFQLYMKGFLSKKHVVKETELSVEI